MLQEDEDILKLINLENTVEKNRAKQRGSTITLGVKDRKRFN